MIRKSYKSESSWCQFFQILAAVLLSREALDHPIRVEAVRAEAGNQVEAEEGSRRPEKGLKTGSGTGKTGGRREKEGRTL